MSRKATQSADMRWWTRDFEECIDLDPLLRGREKIKHRRFCIAFERAMTRVIEYIPGVLSGETQQPDIRAASIHLKDMCRLDIYLSREKPQPDIDCRVSFFEQRETSQTCRAVCMFLKHGQKKLSFWKQRKSRHAKLSSDFESIEIW